MRSLRIVIIALIFLGTTSSTFDMSAHQHEQDMDGAINMAISLSQYEENEDAQALYRQMHPDSQAITHFEAMEGWYRNDFFPLQPRVITEITSVEFITWTWDVTGESYTNTALITFIQPFGPVGATTDVQESIRLVNHDGSWKWFFGRSPEFVDEQIQRYPAAAKEPTAVTRTERSTRTSNSTSVTRTERSTGTSSSTSVNRTEKTTRTSSNSGIPGLSDSANYDHCNLVELYPGYPLYRGNVTGVMGHWGGLGDFQCLEDLEEDFPTFNKVREDQANLKAARELEIGGEPHLWTWENWLQIEAKRGLQPACYSCLFMDQTNQPIMPSLQPDPQDPRIRIGFFGNEQSLRRILLDHNADGALLSLLDFFNYDAYELRAIAYSYDTSANSEELYSHYVEIFTWAVSAWSEQVPSPPIYAAGATEYMSWVLWETGGYTKVPDTSHPGDQVFLFSMSVYSVDNWTSDSGDKFLHGQLEQGVQGWIDMNFPDSLAEYLRDKGYFSG